MTQQFPGEKPNWKVLDILTILLAIVLIGMLSRFFLRNIPDDFIRFLLATLLQASVLIFGVIALTKLRGNNLMDLGLNRRHLISNFFKGIGGGLGLLLIIMLVGIILQRYYNQPPPPQDFESIVREAKSFSHLLIIFLAGSILAPVSEEIFFRGFVYPVFRVKFGIWPAVIVSGLFFGSMHFDLFRLVPLAFGGIGLALLYEKSGSLLTPIVAHATWNFIMTLIIVLGPS